MSATDTALQAPGSQLYKELQDDEIRFVILRPSLWFAAPVQLSLRTTCFSNKPVYTALSYVWGDQNVTSTIDIDTIPKQATTNLVSALRHIRHPRLAQILWIDAICINQKNTKERNHQVQLMATIYKNASEVIAWLGDGYDNSDEAMALMKRWSSALASIGATNLDSYNAAINKFRDTDFAKEFFSKIDNPFPEVAWNALPSLLNRPYWRRLWVVQEFILAKRLFIQCGSKREDWTFMHMIVLWSNFYRHMRLSRVAPRQIIPLIEKAFHNASYYIGLLAWRNEWEEESTLSAYGSVPRLVWLFCAHSCSDPRDYVFGLTGLLEDSERFFDVDYSLEVNETYIGFAKSMIVRADYEVMIFSGIGLTSAGQTSSELPSWSPDWRTLGRMDNTFFNRGEIYSAGLSSTTPVQMPYFGAQNTIIVPGTALCSLSEVLEGFSNWDHPDDTRWKNLIFRSNEGKTYFNGMPLLQAYFKTLLADEDPHLLRRLGGPRKEGTYHNPCVNCSTLSFNFLRRFCIDSCNTISKDEREGFKQKLLTERDISDTLGMGCFYKEDQKPSKEDWVSEIEASDEYLESDIKWLRDNLDRSFFTTKEGYMGNGPPYAQKGDLVCVVQNANVPLIFRPYKDGYQLVGAAFVLGFMDGEVFENVDNSWTPDYFKIY